MRPCASCVVRTHCDSTATTPGYADPDDDAYPTNQTNQTTQTHRRTTAATAATA